MGSCQMTQFLLIDKTSGLPIENAHILHPEKQVITDKNGKALIQTFPDMQIHISHISYRDTSFQLNAPYPRKIRIELEPKINTLPEVRIDTKPVRIFAPAETHVFDFEFWNDSLLVMTYEKEKLFRRGDKQCQPMYIGCELLLISANGSVIDSIPLPDLIQGFYKDPLGQVFILGDSQIVLVDFKKRSLMLSEIDKDEFDIYIKPLSGATATHYFFDDYEWDYPEFSYYRLNKTSDERQRIRTIKDAFTMELFRAEFKYLSNPDKLKALKLEASTGIDKEIYGAYMSGFTHHPYYQELYAPMFPFGEGLIIFDHHSNNIFFHNADGIPVDSTKISYHTSNLKFKNEIIASRGSDKFYAVFQKSGLKSLSVINTETGISENLINLYYPYPEHIHVSGDKVFYIYRRTGSENTKHLFMEQLSQARSKN